MCPVEQVIPQLVRPYSTHYRLSCIRCLHTHLHLEHTLSYLDGSAEIHTTAFDPNNLIGPKALQHPTGRIVLLTAAHEAPSSKRIADSSDRAGRVLKHI